MECGICLESYNATLRRPMLAPCGHTFCRRCMEQLQEGADGNDVPCPVCREPLAQAALLRSNIALLQLLEVQNTPIQHLLQTNGLQAPRNVGLHTGQDLQLEELISQGAFASVWKGRLSEPAGQDGLVPETREVAVKLLPLTGPRQAGETMQREVAALMMTSQQHCSNVVKVLGLAIKDGNLAIVMHLYPGNLLDYLQQQEDCVLSETEAVLMAIDILRGLSELHDLGIIMADVKPENILLGDTNRPLLADFGLSKIVQHSIGHHVATSVGGTPNYMAPEQFLENGVITNRTDMWGFGCTLVHMLTGQPPWAGRSMVQICTQDLSVANEQAGRVLQVVAGARSPPVPELDCYELQQLLQSCLAPDPMLRPSASEALQGMMDLIRKGQLPRGFKIRAKIMPEGTVCPLPAIKPSTTVRELKAQVYAQLGIEPAQQLLTFARRQLVDSDTCKDHGIIPGSTIEVWRKPALGSPAAERWPRSFYIGAKTLTGKTVWLAGIEPSTFMHELKLKIQDEEGVPPCQQRLVYKGRQLEDERTCGDYGIGPDSVIDLILRLTGGKPVICLYPRHAMEVEVALQLNDYWQYSALVPQPDCVDPGQRQLVWRVRAEPDGTITHPGSAHRTYSYLFWEALTAGRAGQGQQGAVTRTSSSSSMDLFIPLSPRADKATAAGGSGLGNSNAEQDMAVERSTQLLNNTGASSKLSELLGPTPADLPFPDFDAARSFCIAGTLCEEFLYNTLTAFGLPVRERTDFLTYWLPHMAGAPWVLISFLTPQQYQAAATLTVTPAPDVLLRVFMVFERLQAPVAVQGDLAAEVQVVGSFLRGADTQLAVLEWGGMEVVRGG